MRDRRFIAEHRGGPLARDDHRCLAHWAAGCAEGVIGCFESRHDDPRPREALAVARDWAVGKVKAGVAMKASVAAHAAARLAGDSAAVAAARAAAHAVATAHAADHAMGALLYAMKALEVTGGDPGAEFERRVRELPAHLRDPVASGVASRAPRLSVPKSRKDDATGGPPPQATKS